MHVFLNYTVVWFVSAPHSLSLPSCGIGGRIRGVKVGKPSGWDKNGLVGKAKQKRNSFTTGHGQVGAQPSPGQQGTIMFNGEG